MSVSRRHPGEAHRLPCYLLVKARSMGLRHNIESDADKLV